jgi:hypothetical protein
MRSKPCGRSASTPQAPRPQGPVLVRGSTASKAPTGGRSPARPRRQSGAALAARRRTTARCRRVSATAGRPHGRGVPSPWGLSGRLTRVARDRSCCRRAPRGGGSRPRAARRRAPARGPPRRRHPSGCPASTAAERPRHASHRADGTAHPGDWRPASRCPAGRGAWGADPAGAGPVAGAGGVCRSAPSPWARRSRRRVRGAALPPARSSAPRGGSLPAAGTPDTVRASHVRDASRHAYPARCGPRQPRGMHPTTLPGGRLLGRSTPRRRPEPRARGGLTRPGGRSPRRSPWCPGYASPVACGAPRLHRRNPREEWWGRPSAAGTSTLPETPSFAWRTNAGAQHGLRTPRRCPPRAG